MATDRSFPSEDQFLCAICLDVFTDPVSIPCGHNFCKACISQHWKNQELCKCPLCNEKFSRGLKLCVNTAFREVVEDFKKQNLLSNNQSVKPGQVACDCCLGKKLKACKTCLVCLTSFCETHLQPHREVPALKRHKLTNPVHDLEKKICKKHNKILELFCRNDQTQICVLCTDHSTHETVPLKEPYVDKTVRMKKTNVEVQGAKQRSGKKGKKSKILATRKDEDEDGVIKAAYRFLPGNMGISEGRYCYAVECPGGDFVLGIVRESLLRKHLKPDPRNGNWLILLRDDCDCCTALHKNPSTFKLMRKPERIGVFVDYDKKLVTFFDADSGVDSGVPFFSFLNCDFRERVFLFCGKREGWVEGIRKRLQNIQHPEILFLLFVLFMVFVSQTQT
ncbi:E3 ubiquitin-protein ligase TRIM8-like [Xyrichtys novacula]|uniref:E3 ubiquitin-protein ligase TRIM8-like n=1 Tax=Xyrichtys novacula TaxID=13765 RepID=A0AAV1FMD1_XYRNO|nr:E3 ubiquitin-protein ligase TRIM8-like [Xyrichtys novacula]